MQYAFGMPVQAIALDANIRAQTISPKAARPQRTLDEINARRAELRAARVAPKMIDVESHEAKALELPVRAGTGENDE